MLHYIILHYIILYYILLYYIILYYIILTILYYIIYPQTLCFAVAKIVICPFRNLLLVQAKRVFSIFKLTKMCILTCGCQWIWARPFCVAGAVFCDVAKNVRCIFVGRRADFRVFWRFRSVIIIFPFVFGRGGSGGGGGGHIHVINMPFNDTTLLIFLCRCCWGKSKAFQSSSWRSESCKQAWLRQTDNAAPERTWTKYLRENRKNI